MKSVHTVITISRTQDLGNSRKGDRVLLVLASGRLSIEQVDVEGNMTRITLSDRETAILTNELRSLENSYNDTNDITTIVKEQP